MPLTLPVPPSSSTWIIDAISSVAGCTPGGSEASERGLKRLGEAEFNTQGVGKVVLTVVGKIVTRR